MIEYKMGKDQAPIEFRFVVYFDTNTDMQVKLMEDDDIDIIVENNFLWGAGITVEQTLKGLKVKRSNAGIRAINVRTEPFPGFPTDLQAQMMALRI